MPTVNEYGQPIGEPVPNWTARPRPGDEPLIGRTCRIELLDSAKHTKDLFEAYLLAPDGRDWTYLLEHRYTELESFQKYIERIEKKDDPKFYAIIDLKTGKPVGMLSYMRIDPANGTIEVGFITLSPLLQKSIQSTEMQYLMMKNAFDDLGYRRYEWKCDALNEPSRKAAARLGFTYDGTFRKNFIYKGRSRDTAWFSIIERDWPLTKAALEEWLKPENFDSDGNQIKGLVEIREKLKK